MAHSINTRLNDSISQRDSDGQHYINTDLGAEYRDAAYFETDIGRTISDHLSAVLQELRKMNLHLSLLTDTQINNTEVE